MPQTLGYDFPFVVNIPAGASVVVATMQRGADDDSHTAMFVHDVSSKVVYCGVALQSALAGHTTSTVDPLAVLARAGWVVVSRVQGVVVGAIVSSTLNTYDHRGTSSALGTQLFVEVATDPYR